MELPSGKCRRTHLMRSQPYFKRWLGAVRQISIQIYVAKRRHNELNQQIIQFELSINHNIHLYTTIHPSMVTFNDFKLWCTSSLPEMAHPKSYLTTVIIRIQHPRIRRILTHIFWAVPMFHVTQEAMWKCTKRLLFAWSNWCSFVTMFIVWIFQIQIPKSSPLQDTLVAEL